MAGADTGRGLFVYSLSDIPCSVPQVPSVSKGRFTIPAAPRRAASNTMACHACQDICTICLRLTVAVDSCTICLQLQLALAVDTCTCI